MALNWKEIDRTKWVGVRPAIHGDQWTATANATNAAVIVYSCLQGLLYHMTNIQLSWNNQGTDGSLLLYTLTYGGVTKDILAIIRAAPSTSGSLDIPIWPPWELADREVLCLSSSTPLFLTSVVVRGWME